MATAIKKCRVCGKTYEACHTMRQPVGSFRWQEVACSPECGSVYLSRIMSSRRGSNNATELQNNTVPDIIESIDSDDELEFDEQELEEYFSAE